VSETLVLVLTDVQGSTALWRDEPTAMDKAMARHHEIVHTAVAEHGGWRPVDQGEGDAVFAAFRSATAALDAVALIQRQLSAEPWPTSDDLKVRIGVHVGEVTERAGNLYGDPVNRCARLRGLGAGGQTLLSAPLYELVRDKLPAGMAVTDLGEHRMKDLTRPEHVWQLDLDGLPNEFRPLASLDRVRHNLPVQPSALIGRQAELAVLMDALQSNRLVTLTGFGGMGKTRLALQAAADLVDDFPDGVWFIDLAAAAAADDVCATTGRLLGLTDQGAGAEAAVLDGMAGQQALLVLDNLEQVLSCAPFVAALIGTCPGVRVIATSREPLRLRGEREIALRPLDLPPAGCPQDAESLSAFAAVQLFIARAVDVRHDFAVTNDNAPAVAAICARLDGHPLAIELAAARIRMMAPASLLQRLHSALSVLTGGSRDHPGRHQTLRATIEWSHELLEEQDRTLLARLSVFPGATTFEAIEAICGEDLDVLSGLASLVEKSLVRVIPGARNDTYRLLQSVRDYTAERLELAGQTQAIRDRHTRWFTARAFAPYPATLQQVHAWYEELQTCVDDVTHAWEAVVASGDPEQILGFAPIYPTLTRDVGDFRRSAEAAWQIVGQPGEGRRTQARALHGLIYLRDVVGFDIAPEPDGPSLLSRLETLAHRLNDAEAHLMAEQFTPMSGLTPEDIHATLGRLDELLGRLEPDCLLGIDYERLIRDSAEGSLLSGSDALRALAASRRVYESAFRDPMIVEGYGRQLLDLGRRKEAIEVLQQLVDEGFVLYEPVARHRCMGLLATTLIEVGEPARALALLDQWRPELVRRSWALELASHDTVRAWFALRTGAPEECLRLLDETDPDNAVGIRRTLLRLQAHRLLGSSDRPGAAELVVKLSPYEWTNRPLWLAARAELALSSDPAEGRLLAHQIRADQGLLVLRYAYDEQLDGLLAEDS